MVSASRWHQFHGNESWARDGVDGLGVSASSAPMILSRGCVSVLGLSLRASAVGPPGNARGPAIPRFLETQTPNHANV